MVLLLQGWNTGYRANYIYKKQQEAFGCGGYYVAAFWQAIQLGNSLQLLSLFSWQKRVIIPLTCLPLFLLKAAIGSSDPSFCHEKMIKASQFLLEKQALVVHVMTLSSLLGSAFVGNFFALAPFLIALVYGLLEERGIIPESVVFFLERYMPAFSLMGLFLESNLLLKVIALFALPAYLFPNFNRQCFYKIDHALRSILPLAGPSLKKSEASCHSQAVLSYQEIEKILVEKEECYELNLGFCSASFDFLRLESNFQRLSEIFEAFSPEDFREALKEYKQICPSSALGHERVKEGLLRLVAILEGRQRASGFLQDLEEAREAIIPLIKYVDENNDIEALLHLASAGNGGCALKIKSVVKELRGRIYLDKGYRARVWQMLHKKREDLVYEVYKKNLKTCFVPDCLISDLTLFKWLSAPIGWGFLPSSNRVTPVRTVADFFYWEKYSKARAQMHQKYREGLEELVEKYDAERGAKKTFFESFLNESNTLSNEQKKALKEGYTAAQDKKKYHRLCFVQLGVLRRIAS